MNRQLELGFGQVSIEPIPTTDAESSRLKPIWRVADGKGKAFVQNEVTEKDVELACGKGFVQSTSQALHDAWYRHRLG